METVIAKLESMIKKYLDEIETKPVKTLFITVIIYYLFKVMSGRKNTW